MRVRLIVLAASAGALVGFAQKPSHMNPVVDLLAAHKPVFGLYAPSNPRGGRGQGRGGPPGGAGAATVVTPPPAPVTPLVVRTPAELAKLAVDSTNYDFVFDGNMEGERTFDSAYVRFGALIKGLADAGALKKTPSPRFTHPSFVKTPIIGKDTAIARERISRQLNLGVTGIVFTGAESADEVKAGLAMMRFKSHGGTRSDDVGGAPAIWGMSAQEYKDRADLWPLNPKGELVNFTIVESKEGLAHVREIAAVKGIGVLFPGAGTLGGVFSTQDSTGRRVRDTVAWEGAIQQVLAACKEFKVPCGYPANDSAMMEKRFNQGFSVFIGNWSEAGFKSVEVGKKLGGR